MNVMYGWSEQEDYIETRGENWRTALDDKLLLRKCAHAVAELVTDGHHVTVVHGGGKALTRTLAQLGKKSEFVTDCASPIWRRAMSP